MFHFQYNLAQPDQVYTLGKELEEISGLAVIDEQTIACVQDELGQVYFYDLPTKTVKSIFKFGKKGDYEGIAFVRDSIYVLRSDGKLFSFELGAKEGTKAKKIKTKLKEVNNTEGLCYDPVNNYLLIACKESASIKDFVMNRRAIYSYDLKSNKLDKTPLYQIRDQSLQRFSKGLPKQEAAKFKSLFHDYQHGVDFQPSGLAIHPESGHLYIIASVGKTLIVLSRDGQILHMAKLNSNLFEQPEGLEFLPNGDLLISNEGKETEAKILRFNSIPK